MDIYSLINSKAIADHCRKISHSFTPLEMAYLINENRSLNIAQKHALFKEIIEQQPDMEVLERPWTPHFASLHTFLQTYMELQNKYLGIFFREEANCVYSFGTKYSNDHDCDWDDRVFSSLTDCKTTIKNHSIYFFQEEDASENDFAEKQDLDLRIEKRWITSVENEYPGYMKVSFGCGNLPTKIWDDATVISAEDRKILTAFEGLWLEIPTPFQKGDILVDNRNAATTEAGAPFVLEWIPYWDEGGKYTKLISTLREAGDNVDYATGIYRQENNGAILCDHGPSYLDLEYCNKELCGRERILTAVSNYLKGEIPLDLLLHSYDILMSKEHADQVWEMVKYLHKDLLVKAGLQ